MLYKVVLLGAHGLQMCTLETYALCTCFEVRSEGSLQSCFLQVAYHEVDVSTVPQERTLKDPVGSL